MEVIRYLEIQDGCQIFVLSHGNKLGFHTVNGKWY